MLSGGGVVAPNRGMRSGRQRKRGEGSPSQGRYRTLRGLCSHEARARHPHEWEGARGGPAAVAAAAARNDLVVARRGGWRCFRRHRPAGKSMATVVTMTTPAAADVSV